MYLLVLGVVLLLLKYLAVGPVADWSWWWVLSPFALTVLWWAFADKTGYTRRKAMEKEAQRKLDRINESRKRLGMPVKPKR
ncbi:TIGR04438 family Trp-rich protein [Macromonas nakdongensis]|jgi:small Trp-rich protein|uniref:TIGR04438 family Trp-rich protein n=1 Tax=Macromonas nakdongensis TaxID=1843082 RepID=UPI000C31E236|nr:TIGR04438 family Trp-rich protein [Macromonas nakdongensis]